MIVPAEAGMFAQVRISGAAPRASTTTGPIVTASVRVKRRMRSAFRTSVPRAKFVVIAGNRTIDMVTGKKVSGVSSASDTL